MPYAIERGYRRAGRGLSARLAGRPSGLRRSGTERRPTFAAAPVPVGLTNRRDDGYGETGGRLLRRGCWPRPGRLARPGARPAAVRRRAGPWGGITRPTPRAGPPWRAADYLCRCVAARCPSRQPARTGTPSRVQRGPVRRDAGALRGSGSACGGVAGQRGGPAMPPRRWCTGRRAGGDDRAQLRPRLVALARAGLAERSGGHAVNQHSRVRGPENLIISERGTGYRVRGALGAETAVRSLPVASGRGGCVGGRRGRPGWRRPSVGVARSPGPAGGACDRLGGAARLARRYPAGSVSAAAGLVGARAGRLRVDVRTGVRSASAARRGRRRRPPGLAVAPGPGGLTGVCRGHGVGVLTAAEFQRRLRARAAELGRVVVHDPVGDWRGRDRRAAGAPGWTARWSPGPGAGGQLSRTGGPGRRQCRLQRGRGGRELYTALSRGDGTARWSMCTPASVGGSLRRGG